MIGFRKFCVNDFFMAFTLAWFCAASSPTKAGDAPDERAKKLAAATAETKKALRGIWHQSAKEINSQVSWTFDDEFLTTEVKGNGAGNQIMKYRYQVNPLKQPAELTLYNDKNLLQGIFKWEKDSLVIATGSQGSLDRPQGFTRETAGVGSGPLVTLTFSRPAEKLNPTGDWASRAVQALIAAEPGRLQSLAKEFQNLPIEARRELPLVIRENAVEFSFQGKVEGPASLANMEYLIAGQDRGYEAMMVAAKPELDRLAELRPFFSKYAGKNRGRRWDAQLSWIEEGRARVGALGDILGKLNDTDRDLFLSGQEIDQQGYFGGEETTGKNVPCDPAFVPQTANTVTLRLTLYFAPKS